MPETAAEVVITARYEDEAGPGFERLEDDMKTLAAGAETLAPLEESLTRTSESMAAFRDQYIGVMDELAGVTRTALEHYVAGSYMAAAKAMSAWIAGAKGGAKEFAKAMLELSARAVLAIGQQAAVKAIFALAEFFMFKDPMALKAAKLYGVVAGMALTAGAGLMAATNSLEGGGEQQGGGGADYTGAGETGTGESRGGGINKFTVNVHVEGHVVDSSAFVEEVVAPALAEAVGRGPISGARYNLMVERD